jgi:hypothetical protein
MQFHMYKTFKRDLVIVIILLVLLALFKFGIL